MKIKIKEVKDTLETAAKKYVSGEEARYFAELTLDTHIKKAPRTNPLKSAIDDLNNWKGKSKAKINIAVNKPSIILLDFKGLAPALKIKYIHDELTLRAKKNGVACVGVKNSGGFHTLNVWTDF